MVTLTIEEVKVSELKEGDSVLIDSEKYYVKSVKSPFRLEIEYSRESNKDSTRETLYNVDETIFKII
ncbi:MAG: hypothetical protein ABSF14_24420, partial [Terriglobia bacterium]